MAWADEDEDIEIARNLWRNSKLLLPDTINLRRWATFLRLLFVINLFVLPIDIFFYHRVDFRQEIFDPLDFRKSAGGTFLVGHSKVFFVRFLPTFFRTDLGPWRKKTESNFLA